MCNVLSVFHVNSLNFNLICCYGQEIVELLLHNPIKLESICMASSVNCHYLYLNSPLCIATSDGIGAQHYAKLTISSLEVMMDTGSDHYACRGVDGLPDWLCWLWSPYVIGQTIIFSCCGLFFLSSFLFFPRLISAAADWMSAILPHMVWP